MGRKVLVLNAFSLGMFREPKEINVKITEVSPAEAERLLKEKGYVSYVGHEGTARMLSDLLNVDIPFNRAPVTLAPGEHEILLTQLFTRLPEGAVLSKDEVLKLYSEGKVKLLHLKVTSKS